LSAASHFIHGKGEAIMTSHMNYEINKELGECYLFMGELDKAEQHYEKAANSNWTHPDPYLGLATVAMQRGHLDNALDLYRRARELEASNKSVTGMALLAKISHFQSCRPKSRPGVFYGDLPPP
jgi:tetratricopeptide (TPR) repeat protein